MGGNASNESSSNGRNQNNNHRSRHHEESNNHQRSRHHEDTGSHPRTRLHEETPLQSHHRGSQRREEKPYLKPLPKPPARTSPAHRGKQPGAWLQRHYSDESLQGATAKLTKKCIRFPFVSLDRLTLNVNYNQNFE